MSTTRDALRAELLKTRPPASKLITFFGQQIEIKQLTLEAVLDVGANPDQRGLINVLLQYAYIPGTNEKIFEEGDIETLKQLPFGGDFVTLTDAISELTNLNFPTPGDASKQTASSAGPSPSPTT